MLVIWLLSLSLAAGRIWTTTEGERIEAELISCQNGMVVLQKEAGGRTLLQLERLIPGDREAILAAFPDGSRRERVGTVTTQKPAHSQNDAFQPPPRAEQGAPDSEKPSNSSLPPHPGLKTLNPGDPAPLLSGRLQGVAEQVRLQDLRGRFVIILFWSSHFPAAVQEAQRYARLYPQLKQLGIAVIGVSNEASYRTLEGVERKHGITWPVALDPRRELAKQWGIQAYPTAVLIDPSGRIAEEHVWSLELNDVLGQYLRPR